MAQKRAPMVRSSRELEENVEDSDGDVDVSGYFAEILSVSELKTEEVGGSHEVTNPSTGSENTIPGVADGFFEGSWESSGVGLLKEGETEEGDVVSLEGELNVTVHVAREIGWISESKE